MRRGVKGIGFCLAFFLLALKPVYGQEAQGLAAGWLGLDSSVGVVDKKIEEGKSSLEKALGISISGFLDTSYTWSSNRPRSAFDRDITGRYFDQDHNSLLFNDFNLTLEKPEKDWGVGLKAVADFGRTGELLREGTFWGGAKAFPAETRDEPSVELREAFLTYTVPVGAGLQLKAGKFVTLLGTEILSNPGAYNENISRSFLFNLGVPLTHTGLLMSYPVHKMLSVTAGPVKGWDSALDNNGKFSLLGGITVTPTDSFSLASNIVSGPERHRNSQDERLVWSNVATIKPWAPLTLFLEYTYGQEEKATASRRDATWQGWAGIASYNWTDRFTTALRGEIFKDSDGARNGVLSRDVRLSEITVTGAYKFTSKLLGRVELRRDSSNRSFYAERNAGRDKNQTTLALQALYTF